MMESCSRISNRVRSAECGRSVETNGVEECCLIEGNASVLEIVLIG